MKYSFFFLFLLLIPMSIAISGGETETIYDQECDLAYINITAQEEITPGEYELIGNCDEISINYFNCTCESPLKVKIGLSTTNKYNAEIDVWNEKNETSEEIEEVSIGNTGVENITREFTLPNNIKVNKIIPPGEIITYIQLPTEEIIIPDSNVTFNKIEKVSNVIQINATSSGNKCFDIYSTNKPYEIKANGIRETFSYAENLIHFCTHFSTKTININFNTPGVETPTSNDGSSGSGSYNSCSSKKYWKMGIECTLTCGDYYDNLMKSRGYLEVESCDDTITEVEVKDTAESVIEAEGKQEIIKPNKEKEGRSFIHKIVFVLVIGVLLFALYSLMSKNAER